METYRTQITIQKDGELTLQNLPVESGQEVEVVLLIPTTSSSGRPGMTAKKFLEFGLVGIWKDREDITDSEVYARQLREKAQNRHMD